MILEKLSILNYKNIIQAEMVFSPGINCFFGNNGMGKTNLLDAIYYLSFCKSSCKEPICMIPGGKKFFAPSVIGSGRCLSGTRKNMTSFRSISACCRW